MSETNYAKERRETNRVLRVTEGELQHHIDMFGDELAKRYKYRKHTGIEAVWWFLIEKYHWKPADVKAMNHEDLSFLLEEERSNSANRSSKTNI